MRTGADPGFNSDALGEADLDLEWAGAVARNASFIYVYSADANVAAVYAIDQHLAPVISESFGLCEANVAVSMASAYQAEAQKANSMGITWVVSSGDQGAAACDYGANVATLGLATNFPASIPEVTAVGGTEFNESSGYYWSSNSGNYGVSALSYIPETAWNDTAYGGGLSATGGGVSILFPKPAWQTGAGVPEDNARDLPDIAMDSSNDHDPYNVLTYGQWELIGGASTATPVFAGVLALLNHYLTSTGVMAQPGVGNINTVLYGLAQSNPNVFHDVILGNNIVPCQAGTPACANGQFGYNAGPGYDLVTGLGSVDAYNLITNWTGATAGKVVLTSMSPAIITAGGKAFTLTVNGSNFASGATVNWNGKPLSSTFVSAVKMTAAVTADLIASAGTAAITVSSGANVSGALYFTIDPAAPPPLSISDQRITSQPPPAAGCTVPPAATSFSTSLKTVYLYFVAVTTATDALSNDWLAPDGTLVAGGTWSPQAGSFCYTSASLAIGSLAGSKLGSWQARIYDNGKLLLSIPFTVTQASVTIPVISSVRNSASYATGVCFRREKSWCCSVPDGSGPACEPRAEQRRYGGHRVGRHDGEVRWNRRAYGLQLCLPGSGGGSVRD